MKTQRIKKIGIQLLDNEMVDYLMIHFLAVIIMIFTSMCLYLLEYGWTDSLGEVFQERVKVEPALIVLLTIYMIYPVVWTLSHYTLKELNGRMEIIGSSAISLSLGILAIAVLPFLCFEMFFDFRYGMFSFLFGLTTATAVYQILKRRILNSQQLSTT